MKLPTKILIVCGILAVLFIQLRPAIARRACANNTIKMAKEGKLESFSGVNQTYRTCLAKWGSKPEDLVNK